ncbi:asparagine synthetase B family protein [Kitasatospora sp. NPDC048239]|uniref:asparagine synthetase B family protein n=1 Tax=Kitasatospora sp. NPDC048239 TaxID=3364046 RepID=UPI003712C9B6
MSGIAGWVDRGRDLAAQELSAARLAAGLAARGQAGEGWLTDRHAVFAQRVDAAWTGAAQPAAVYRDGRLVAMAVCDGYLHNGDELWRAAASRSTAAATPAAAATRRPGSPDRGEPSVSEVLLRCYLAWGQDALPRLEGCFAFAIWDARRSELLLGRDRLGVQPLSYLPTADGAVFASDVAVLAEHPMVTPELDSDGLCGVLTQLRPWGRGALRGVREVPPAHLVRIGVDGERAHRYWSLEARPHTLDRNATIERAGELLRSAVERDARGTDPAVLLSGGLDSSALTGLVASGTGRPPRTFTVVFGSTAAAVPDRPFAREVAEFWGCDAREVTVRPEELSDPVALADVLSAKDYPSPFGDKDTTPYLFSRQVARRVPVVLSGEAADSVFGGIGGAIDGERRLESFPWIERARRFGVEHGIGTGLFAPDLLRDIDVTGYLDRRFHEASAEVPYLPGESAVHALARQVDYLVVTRLLEQGVGHSERLSAAAGLQVRFPFLDHRLLTFLYNVPPEVKSFDGREKSLLRAIARDLLPDSVLARAKVPYPITYAGQYKAALLQRLRRLLDDASAPVLPLVDAAAVKRLLDTPDLLDRGGWIGRADVEMVLKCDAWLRRLRVGIRL